MFNAPLIFPSIAHHIGGTFSVVVCFFGDDVSIIMNVDLNSICGGNAFKFIMDSSESLESEKTFLVNRCPLQHSPASPDPTQPTKSNASKFPSEENENDFQCHHKIHDEKMASSFQKKRRWWDWGKHFSFRWNKQFFRVTCINKRSLIESILFRYHKPIRKCVDLGMKTVGRMEGENEIYNPGICLWDE